MGDVLFADKKTTDALGHYQEAWRIRQQLSEADPANTEWKLGLMRSNVKIGSALASQSKSARARLAFVFNLKSLADSTAKCLNTTGDLFARTDRTAEPLDAFRKSLKIAQELAQRDPGNTLWQGELATSYELVGDMLLRAGKKEDALTNHQAALKIRQDAVRSDPKNIPNR
jgi:tetratricopeptide (TPR) repeat protein